MARIENLWQTRNPLTLLLYPLSLLFGGIASLRTAAYRLGLFRRQRFDVPVLVVGNISVGGTGKTPLVIWLAGFLRQLGFRPGIVSRGYGGRAAHWPQQVRADSDPAAVGDEAVMLAARTGCPMCVGPDRPEAIRALCRFTDINIIISDDGLQHYAMTRDLEIAVIDGERRLGNGFRLPAGPLRESGRRLERVDMVVVNGQGGEGEYSMEMQHPTARRINKTQGLMPLSELAPGPVHAVAGIGNPARFFDLLGNHGLEIRPHAFSDHHRYRAKDLVWDEKIPILMTEKDAVKCRRLLCDDCWVVQVDAQPDAAFVHNLKISLKGIVDGQKAAGHTGLPDL